MNHIFRLRPEGQWLFNLMFNLPSQQRLRLFLLLVLYHKLPPEHVVLSGTYSSSLDQSAWGGVWLSGLGLLACNRKVTGSDPRVSSYFTVGPMSKALA